MKETIDQLKIAFKLILVLTIILGVLYPLLVTGVAQLVFPWQANGSILSSDGKKIGSVLIGQYFHEDKYFWGRPSATARFPYDAEKGSGSNLALSNPQYLNLIKARIETLRRTNPEQSQRLIPIDLVMASGSGLDPEISVAAAYYQIPRIARARNIPLQDVEKSLKPLIRGYRFAVLGEPRVNVLKLNLSLDQLNVRKGD